MFRFPVGKRNVSFIEDDRMEKALEFLKTNKEVAFATVEGDKPKIRVFQIMKQQGNTLYFVTAPKKEVYRQLQENPNVEILAMKENIFVRIAGQAMFDVDDTTAREICCQSCVAATLQGIHGFGLFPLGCRKSRLLRPNA